MHADPPRAHDAAILDDLAVTKQWLIQRVANAGLACDDGIHQFVRVEAPFTRASASLGHAP